MRQDETAQPVHGMLSSDFATAILCGPRVTDGEAWAEAAQHLGPVADTVVRLTAPGMLCYSLHR